MLNIHTLHVGPMGANVYIVNREGSTAALVIDAGDDAERILATLNEQSLVLEAILLTHGHFDHILAASALREATGAKIHIHEKDAAMLGDPALNFYAPMAANTPFSPFAADVLLMGGEFQCASLAIRLIESPGHTPGGLCYDFVGENALFTGDTLFAGGGIGRTDLPGGDPRALYSSVKTLLALPGETHFYPGHGQSETINKARGYFR